MTFQAYHKHLLENLTTEHGLELTTHEIEHIRDYIEKNFQKFKEQKKSTKTNNTDKTKCECLVWSSTQCKMTGGMKYAPKNLCIHYACDQSLENEDIPNLCKRCYKKYCNKDDKDITVWCGTTDNPIIPLILGSTSKRGRHYWEDEAEIQESLKSKTKRKYTKKAKNDDEQEKKPLEKNPDEKDEMTTQKKDKKTKEKKHKKTKENKKTDEKEKEEKKPMKTEEKPTKTEEKTMKTEKIDEKEKEEKKTEEKEEKKPTKTEEKEKKTEDKKKKKKKNLQDITKKTKKSRIKTDENQMTEHINELEKDTSTMPAWSKQVIKENLFQEDEKEENSVNQDQQETDGHEAEPEEEEENEPEDVAPEDAQGLSIHQPEPPSIHDTLEQEPAYPMPCHVLCTL